MKKDHGLSLFSRKMKGNSDTYTKNYDDITWNVEKKQEQTKEEQNKES